MHAGRPHRAWSHSGRRASCNAAQMIAPLEMPTGTPSSRLTSFEIGPVRVRAGQQRELCTAVGHVERSVPLAELDAIPDGQPPLLDALDFEAPVLLRVDLEQLVPALDHEPVVLLVDGRHAQPLASLDAAPAPHETEHVAGRVVRRPRALLRGQVLLHHHLRLEAVSFDLPSLDRADDGGHLAAHRVYWGLPAGSQSASRPVTVWRRSTTWPLSTRPTGLTLPTR